ncbi:ABC transporter permease [Nonomuraea sp. NPDC049309]|uniref:ABC transporter permease n=1 Tax=Nonomuraea sp. NPDC049309 TaxID=3364350 RepID=UPI00371909AF
MKAITKLWLIPVVLVVWEFGARAIGDGDFPPPTTIVAKMYEMWFSGPGSRAFLTDDAIDNILPSLGRMFGGWILAAAIGIVAGMLLGRSRTATDFVDPLIEFGRALPPPLLIPAFLVLQAGFQSPHGVLITQLITIVFGVIWPVLLNSIDGVRAIDKTYMETATVFNLTRMQRLRVVILPAASPKIFAGLRLSLSLALILMVITELIGGSDGIGYQLLQAQRSFDGAAVWAAITLLGILGYVVNSLFVLAERRVLVWHRQATRNP